MKKKIIFGDGTSKIMEFNEEFLKTFRTLAKKTLAEYRKGSILDITEDESQELDIVIYQSFQKYNEKNAFSTLLVWEVKGYAGREYNKNTTKKRDGSNFTFVNLDWDVDNDDGKNGSMHELISDESINCFELENNDLINYIKARCTEIEKGILLVFLNQLTYSDVARMTNTTNGNVTFAKKKFLKRLEKWIYEYNYCIA